MRSFPGADATRERTAHAGSGTTSRDSGPTASQSPARGGSLSSRNIYSVATLRCGNAAALLQH